MGQITQDRRKLGSPPRLGIPTPRNHISNLIRGTSTPRIHRPVTFADAFGGGSWVFGPTKLMRYAGMPHTSCWAGGRLNSWWIRSVSSWCWMLTNQVFFTRCMLSDYWLKRSRGSPEDSYSHFDSGFPRVDCEAKVKLWAGQILKSTPCIPTNCY